MPKADNINTTPAPGRRALLGGAAALLAGTAAVMLPRAALAASSGTNARPDAELIRLCDRLVAIRAEENAICAADEWAPDHGPYKARYDALWEEHGRVTAQLYDTADPVTAAGLRAAARAALCAAPRDADGDITCDGGLAEWLAFGVVQHVAREGVA